jgi:DNA-binding transcriptional ArsR family regulator
VPTDLLSKLHSELHARLGTLRSDVVEYERLLRALDALGSTRAGEASTAAPKAKRRSSSGNVSPDQRRRANHRRATHPHSDPVQRVIIDTLTRGPHTTGELVAATGVERPHVRFNVRRLIAAGAITKNQHGTRTEYALAVRPTED